MSDKGYVFMWDRERIQIAIIALRFVARTTGPPAARNVVRAAADDLELALMEPVTGARFTHRGAE